MASSDRVTKSPCCGGAIYYARGEHGVSIGSCGNCGESVSRVNPRTGVLEWLEGRHPEFEGTLPPVYESPACRPSHAGFTIVELLIVLAMIGIIAAIAIPSYLRAKDSLTRQRAQASGTVDPAHHAAHQPAPPILCPTKQTAPDTWLFACSAEPFSRAFSSWRAAHPHLTVRMVVPFAYRFMSDTEVLVITDNPAPRPPAEQEERR